jgi:hypothetical protein
LSEPAAAKGPLELSLLEGAPSVEEKEPALGESEATTAGIDQAFQDVDQRS